MQGHNLNARDHDNGDGTESAAPTAQLALWLIMPERGKHAELLSRCSSAGVLSTAKSLRQQLLPYVDDYE